MTTTEHTALLRDNPAQKFCQLCREGRLFEAEAWLQEKKPARYDHRNPRCTPLGIAIDRNFHSLVEVLLRNGFQPTPKHLWMAVRKGRTGIIELMLRAGADVKWLDFKQVIYWPNPDVLRLFIERGADTQSGYPIADVLKRAPRAFIGLYKDLLPSHPDWQFQSNMALRHFCDEGSMRGVCLLLWLKADPRTKVPREAGDEEDTWRSGLWHACLGGHFEIVKKIGPSKDVDDLDELLSLACSAQNAELVEYLIRLGANPNAVPANGDTAVRSALWALEWRLDLDRHQPYGYRSSDSLALLKKVVQLGARLNTVGTDELSFFRRCLLKLHWSDSYDLIKFLNDHRFADEPTMTNLLKVPKMRDHLAKRLPALARMFPAMKKWADRTKTSF